jgi:hypothetical protein
VELEQVRIMETKQKIQLTCIDPINKVYYMK